jgi:1,4-alpha-glucan branching enzyme
MYAQAGKKLLFMGAEVAQWREWTHEDSVDWHLLEDRQHAGVHRLVGDLNRMYRNEPALHELDLEERGFEWVAANDSEQSVISFLRRGTSSEDTILAVLNLTPSPRYNYRLGVPRGGFWREILNSDSTEYGGSGHGNMGGLNAVPFAAHNRPFSLTLTLPPLGAVFLKSKAE